MKNISKKLLSSILLVSLIVPICAPAFAGTSSMEKEEIRLIESTTGSWKMQENTTDEGILAVRANDFDGYEATIAGEKVAMLQVTDNEFQMSDEILLTNENIETVINEYSIHESIANDLRTTMANLNSETDTLTLFVPSKKARAEVSYSYEGHPMKLLTAQVERTVPEYVTVATGTNAEMRFLGKLTAIGINAIGLKSTEVAIASFTLSAISSLSGITWHGYNSDFLQVGLLENKTRRYVCLGEEAYAPRAMADDGTFSFALHIGSGNVEKWGNTPTVSYGSNHSRDYLSAKALAYMYTEIGQTMYQDTYPYFEYEETGERFVSVLQ